jgi:membrane protease YdiL (CAAX protease family)
MIGLLAAPDGGAEGRFAAALALRWVAIAALLAFVVGVERLPLQSVGISKPRVTDMVWAGAIGLVSAVVGIGLYLFVQGFEPGVETAAGQLVSAMSLLGKIHLILNAAIVEELFFRGFLIERTTTATHRVWLAGIASFVLFVVSHLSGSGLIETLTIVSVGTLVFVLLYLWRRNLVLCVVAHTVSNAPLLLS